MVFTGHKTQATVSKYWRKNSPSDTRYDHVYAPATGSKYSQKNILGSWLIACRKHTPVLVRQMWRHNYIVGRNEYLIPTLSESTVT